jgi:ElaB/YqjD/DUF883 family membrane-anchored ribosome-binding protein
MDNEPEVTRAQMDETRNALSDKLEMLENQVVNAVRGATKAVAKTVKNVTDSVQETVGSVKDSLDLPLQVKRHPWGMVGGSIALGYLGGYLLARSGSGRPRANGRIRPAPPDTPRISRQANSVVQRHRSVEQASEKKAVQEVASGPSDAGWLSAVNNQFGPELTQLKGLAIGTVLSVVRDLIIQSVSEPMKAELGDVMDRITVKLGGEPFQGPVLKEGCCSKAKDLEDRNTLEMQRPLRATQSRFSK